MQVAPGRLPNHFSEDCVIESSFFVYFIQLFEKKPTTVKNYGIWVRYQSRTGYHNMYKEYRDVTLNGAVSQLYQEMASRHRVRYPCIQIIKTATVPASACKRPNIQQVRREREYCLRCGRWGAGCCPCCGMRQATARA